MLWETRAARKIRKRARSKRKANRLTRKESRASRRRDEPDSPSDGARSSGPAARTVKPAALAYLERTFALGRPSSAELVAIGGRRNQQLASQPRAHQPVDAIARDEVDDGLELRGEERWPGDGHHRGAEDLAGGLGNRFGNGLGLDEGAGVEPSILFLALRFLPDFFIVLEEWDELAASN